MNRTVLLIVLLLILIGGGWTVFRYMNPTRSSIIPADGNMITLNTSAPTINPKKVVEYKVEEVVRGLYVPWSIVFTSADRMLVTERDGKIREVKNNILTDKPLLTFTEVSQRSEEGLMSLVLDPEYETNKYIYTSLAYTKNDTIVVRVQRLIDQGNTLKKDTIIIDNLPAAPNHAGSRLRFGPDKKLYITTGDASKKEIAQDLESLGGKILRINSDGSIPADNPFPNSAIYSYGHRNPQGIDWYPGTSILYQTEHGPSTFDGPPGGDEVNVIEKGQNYGWPLVSHDKTKEGTVPPAIVFTPAVAPASGMFYNGDIFPQFKNNFFFGALRGEGIFRVIVNPDNPRQVTSYGKLANIAVGRVRDIVQGPDGYIYFTTSNRDGRGTLQAGDDKIYRLIP